VPKGGRDRRVPMTKRLASLLAANRHLKGPRVLYRDNGQPATRAAVSRWMAKAQKRAGLPVTRALHVLRHYAERWIMPTRDAPGAAPPRDTGAALVPRRGIIGRSFPLRSRSQSDGPLARPRWRPRPPICTLRGSRSWRARHVRESSSTMPTRR
jgi:hypothetical protein